MKFVNLTPHEIVVEVANGMRVSIPSTGNCRVSVKQTLIDQLFLLNHEKFPIPVFQNTYGEVEGLPFLEKDTTYIVSLMVINALRSNGRLPFVAPDTGTSAIREDGKIVAVRQFIRG